MARYRERFGGTTEEELLARYRASTPAPARVRKQLDLPPDSMRVATADEHTVYIAAHYATEIVVVTTVPLGWYTRLKDRVKERVRRNRQKKRYN